MTQSLLYRNPEVLDSGDTLLIALLTWSMLLPLGCRFSIDRWLTPSPIFAETRFKNPVPGHVFSLATTGILMQVVLLYVFAGMWKSHPAWSQDGIALHMALSLDRFATPFGIWMRNLPAVVLKTLTLSTFWLELAGATLAFSPFFFSQLRTLAVSLFISLHLGIGATLSLGIFPAVCVTAWLLFLPAWFWDRIAAGFLSWIGSLVPQMKRTTLHLPLCFQSKKKDGAASEGMPINNPLQQGRLYYNIAAAILAGLIFYQNMFSFRTPSGHSVTTEATDHYYRKYALPYIGAFRLAQTWRMFSRYPATTDGWVRAVGTLEDGSRVDVFTPALSASGNARPTLISATYRDQRWRNFLGGSIIERGRDHLAPSFLAYLWNRWNKKHSRRPEKKLSSLSLYIYTERYGKTKGDDPALGVVEKRHLSTITRSP